MGAAVGDEELAGVRLPGRIPGVADRDVLLRTAAMAASNRLADSGGAVELGPSLPEQRRQPGRSGARPVAGSTEATVRDARRASVPLHGVHPGEVRCEEFLYELKVNVWRGQAEHLADSLAEGDRVMVTGRLRQRSWETPEGDKRSVTEIEADEVGASLKWAIGQVERTSQRANGGRSQGRERQDERGGDFNDAPPTY
jgi:hypothetical protein